MGLVWSLEPGWPRRVNDKFEVNTPAARQVLTILSRSPLASQANFSLTLSQHFMQRYECVNRFARLTGSAVQEDNSDNVVWLLASRDYRILFWPHALVTRMPFCQLGYNPLSVTGESEGHSLLGGKCLVLTRHMTVNPTNKRKTEEAVEHLTARMLSLDVQRAICLEQFEMPARRGVITTLKRDEIVTSLTNRFAFAGARKMPTDIKLEDQGEQVLQFLKEVEQMLEKNVVYHHPCSLSLHQRVQIDSRICELLTRISNDTEQTGIIEATLDDIEKRLNTDLRRQRCLTEHSFP